MLYADALFRNPLEAVSSSPHGFKFCSKQCSWKGRVPFSRLLGSEVFSRAVGEGGDPFIVKRRGPSCSVSHVLTYAVSVINTSF